MSMFDGEIRTHDTLRGDVSLVGVRRSSIKMNTKPRIVVCVPVGAKQKASLFKTPDGQQWLTNAASVPASIPAQWAVSQMQLVAPLCTYLAYLWQWGLLSGEARQILTMKALDMVQDDGYILYWDDDVIPEPMALYTLYSFMEQNPEAGVVSGVYSTRQEPTEPVVYKEHMKGTYWGLTVGPDAEPEEVLGFGAGFMLARASAVRSMVEANPGVPIWADSKTISVSAEDAANPTTTYGHDIRFCCLMAEAGWKVYVDGRVELGHLDAAENKIYKLPADSAPKRRGRGARPTRPGTIGLILPTYGHLDYAEKAARSFLTHTRSLEPHLIIVDDASPDITNEQFAEWAAGLGADSAHRFPDNAGLTRSWNRGLELCRELGMEYAVCGNSDLIFSPGWDAGIVEALRDHDLVGPLTNAPGWGLAEQQVAQHVPEYETDDSPEAIAAIAARLVTEGLTVLPAPVTGYHADGKAGIVIPSFLNGFCLVARTATWWAGAFSKTDVFDPSHPMTENETELQIRWAVAGRKRALARSSFVFHYRSVSRGEEFNTAGAFRPAEAIS